MRKRRWRTWRHRSTTPLNPESCNATLYARPTKSPQTPDLWLAECKQNSLPSRSRADAAAKAVDASGRAPEIVGERAVGQGFGQMEPADLVGAIEVGQRPGDAQHAMIAACRQPHGLGGVAQQFQALRVPLP